jgi:hypothetical protein
MSQSVLRIDPRPIRGRPFAPGNPGRRPGSVNKTTKLVAELIREAGPELTRVLIECALARDMAAMKILAPGFLPKQRAFDLELPKVNGSGDAAAVLAAIFEAVTTGRITVAEATALTSLIEAYSRLIAINQFESRLEALEKQVRAE